MEVYEVNSSIHGPRNGHHIFKEIWTPFIGECKREMNQIPEMCSYAVGIM